MIQPAAGGPAWLSFDLFNEEADPRKLVSKYRFRAETTLHRSSMPRDVLHSLIILLKNFGCEVVVILQHVDSTFSSSALRYLHGQVSFITHPS